MKISSCSQVPSSAPSDNSAFLCDASKAFRGREMAGRRRGGTGQSWRQPAEPRPCTRGRPGSSLRLQLEVSAGVSLLPTLRDFVKNKFPRDLWGGSIRASYQHHSSLAPSPRRAGAACAPSKPRPLGCQGPASAPRLWEPPCGSRPLRGMFAQVFKGAGPRLGNVLRTDCDSTGRSQRKWEVVGGKNRLNDKNKPDKVLGNHRAGFGSGSERDCCRQRVVQGCAMGTRAGHTVLSFSATSKRVLQDFLAEGTALEHPHHGAGPCGAGGGSQAPAWSLLPDPKTTNLR